MIIKADKEGIKAIAELADAVLKALGLQAHTRVSQILSSIQELKEDLPVIDSPTNYHETK
jgi:predicted ATP-dependent serine protease